MIRVQVGGLKVSCKESQGGYTHSRLVMAGDKPIHLIVRKESQRERLRNAPLRSFVSVTGLMHSACRFTQEGTPYVHQTVEVESLQCFQSETTEKE